MEPITIAIVGVLLVVRYGVTDSIAAARGTEPARLQARRERHERAMERGPGVGSAMAARAAAWLDPAKAKREPGPMRRWFSLVWRDAFEHAGEVHERREGQRKAGTLPRQRAWRATCRGAKAAGRAVRDRVEKRQTIRVDSERADRAVCLDCGRTAAEHCPECSRCEPTRACEQKVCVQEGEVVDDSEPSPRPADPAPAPEPTPEPRQGATVTPIRPEGDPDMTAAANLNGETYNPETAIAYGDQIKAAAASMQSSFEQSESNLTGHVEGEAIALLASMKDHASGLAADAEKFSAVFQKIKEAGEAAAAAGYTDKTFMHAG